MNMVDDAQGTTLCQLGEQETIWAAVNVLESWIKAYGVPRALYVDGKNVYKRKPTEKEVLRGEVPVTQFGRMCEKPGIRIIAAGSAQAKGRVERNHGTHQDSADQEDAAQEDSDTRGGEPISERGIPAGA
jgi:hypothetical protein